MSERVRACQCVCALAAAARAYGRAIYSSERIARRATAVECGRACYGTRALESELSTRVRYRGLKYPRNSSEFDMEMYGMKTCGAPPTHPLAYSPTHSPTRPSTHSECSKLHRPPSGKLRAPDSGTGRGLLRCDHLPALRERPFTAPSIRRSTIGPTASMRASRAKQSLRSVGLPKQASRTHEHTWRMMGRS